MLKRRLKIAGLITLCFICMSASPIKKVAASHTSKVDRHFHRDYYAHAFDSTGLCVCLPELSDDALYNAPKVQLNKHVAGFVKDYLKVNSFHLQKMKPKSDYYFAIFDSVFSKYELPVELKYLAVIESKLNPTIFSKAGAAGLWQLMPSAARSFGLKVNGKTDERKNVYKSTVAAAKVLVYLNDRFRGDWLLTLAAYNCGPAPVYAAIKKSGSRNFWALQQYLPLESRKHVKKFISIHYFFEGHGSVTTMTKAETDAHVKAVAGFILQQEKVNKNDSTFAGTETVNL